MVSCFTVIRFAIPTIFHGEIVAGDIQIGVYFCKRICKLVCYGSRRSYFLFFIFFVAPINWCYCISSASYDIDI